MWTLSLTVTLRAMRADFTTADGSSVRHLHERLLSRREERLARGHERGAEEEDVLHEEASRRVPGRERAGRGEEEAQRDDEHPRRGQAREAGQARQPAPRRDEDAGRDLEDTEQGRHRPHVEDEVKPRHERRARDQRLDALGLEGGELEGAEEEEEKDQTIAKDGDAGPLQTLNAQKRNV